MSNFVINTSDKLKEKMDLVGSLIDIQIAFKASDQKKSQTGQNGKKVTNKKSQLIGSKRGAGGKKADR